MAAKWSKKTYVMVAEHLAAQRWLEFTERRKVIVDQLAGRFADTFGADNPNFDRARFLAAARKES